MNLPLHPERIMTELARELRYAVRRLRRAPLFSLTVTGTLALGIGACSLMFSILSAVLLKPLAYREPDRVVMIWGHYPQLDLGFSEQPIHGRYYRYIRENTRAFSAVSAFRSRAINLGEGATPERLNGIEATGGFFEALGISPAVGRFFTEAEEAPGKDRVVVLSESLWRRRFGADPAVVGRTILLDGEPYLAIGVAPRGFAFPRGAEMPGTFQLPAAADAWVPLAPPQRGPTDLALVARLGPGVTAAAAVADLDRLAREAETTWPEARGFFGTRIVPLPAQVQSGVAPMLWSLLGAAGLVLLVACVNVAQLLLARWQARRRDLAISSALGASGRRRVASLSAEVVVLVAAAGAAGSGLGAAGVSLVRALGASRIPRLAGATFDVRMAGAAILASLLAALLAGVAPAILAGRIELAEALRRTGRGLAGGAERFRRALIVAELALSVLLLAGAGLLVRSLARQIGESPGFAMPQGVTFEITLPPTAYPEQQFRTYMEHPRAVALFTDLLTRLNDIPGVEAAGLGKPLPLGGAQEASGFVAEGAEPPAPEGGGTIAEYTVVSGGLLRALGTRLIRGRDFNAADGEGSPPVVIVNQAMARWLWPGADPVGKRLKLGGAASPAPWMTVVGVTEDVRRYSLTDVPRPEMLVPYTQKPYPTFATMQFAVRSSRPLTELVPAIRQALRAADPTLPLSRVRTMLDLVNEASANARFAARFMSGFSLAALLLALVGLYGVIAYGVMQRQREFGLRRALGASPRDIVRLVIRDGWRLAGAGLALGIAGALAGGRLLGHLLYHTSPADPGTVIGVALLLALAATVASLLPARQAARVEPRVALEEQ